MDQIYKVGGTLNKDFCGQISYSFCLGKTYEKLAIMFSFDKQRPENVTDELREDFLIRYLNGEGLPEFAEPEALIKSGKYDKVLLGQKTEIHITASLNDTFIGGIHKQLQTRCMFFSPTQASLGCIPQSSIEGVLKITIIVFRVLFDNTPYCLTVLGE